MFMHGIRLLFTHGYLRFSDLDNNERSYGLACLVSGPCLRQFVYLSFRSIDNCLWRLYGGLKIIGL